MKIITALKLSLPASFRLWKGIMIFWITSYALVSLLTNPLKASLKSGIGQSLITEKLADGINLEVIADLAQIFRTTSSAFFSGLFLVILFWLAINSFFTGGFFGSLGKGHGKFILSDFFRLSAVKFWKYLIIALVMSAISIFIFFICITIPSIISGALDPISEGAGMKSFVAGLVAFLLIIPLLILSSDFARAKLAVSDFTGSFSSIGYGFGMTFRAFKHSYPMMLFLLLIQILYSWLMLTLIAGFKPASGGGIFLLFILSQALIVLRITLKIWRYSSVTVLMNLYSDGKNDDTSVNRNDLYYSI